MAIPLRVHFCSLHRKQNQDRNPNQSTLAHGPGYLRTDSLLVVPVLFLVTRGIGKEVTLEETGQSGGGAFGTRISPLHGIDLGVIIAMM